MAESADLWYSGAGATQSHGVIQGFSGRPSGGDNYLGTSMEFTAQYKLTKDINTQVFYGHIFGGDVIKNNFSDNADMDYFFFETNIVF